MPRFVRTAGLSLLVASAVASQARAECTEEEVSPDLSRHTRAVVPRLFVKAYRHELSALGGVYAADLYSSSLTGGGAYSFHLSEDLALEASVMTLRFRSKVSETYERRYPLLQLQERANRVGMLYFGHLVWSLGYAKIRWFGTGGITRLDFNVQAGAGVTDDREAQGITGSVGVGTKWFFGKWFALRLDVRDQILRQSLLGEEHLVSNVLVTLGASMFFPFGG